MAAKIPTYEQRGQVGALPGTPRASAPTGFGQALQDVGAIGRNFVADEQRRAERDEHEAGEANHDGEADGDGPQQRDQSTRPRAIQEISFRSGGPANHRKAASTISTDAARPA
jgi:hypothetical protein